MGQHKYNPTAIAAKKGELPPKKSKMSKKEAERIAYAKIYDSLNAKTEGLLDVLINGEHYY